MKDTSRIRWAPRLPPRLLERLYHADAKGLRDEELCDEIGLRLHARCETFVRVQRGEVECPACGAAFPVAPRGASPCPSRGCGWSTTARAYRESVRNHYAHPGRAIEAFAAFHRRYPAARSYAEKILLIDELIHAFHVDEATGAPAKSVASKLLEGGKTEVVRFLDRLSAADPAVKTRWRESVSGTLHRRLVAREPPDEPEPTPRTSRTRRAPGARGRGGPRAGGRRTR